MDMIRRSDTTVHVLRSITSLGLHCRLDKLQRLFAGAASLIIVSRIPGRVAQAPPTLETKKDL